MIQLSLENSAGSYLYIATNMRWSIIIIQIINYDKLSNKFIDSEKIKKNDKTIESNRKRSTIVLIKF